MAVCRDFNLEGKNAKSNYEGLKMAINPELDRKRDRYKETTVFCSQKVGFVAD